MAVPRLPRRVAAGGLEGRQQGSRTLAAARHDQFREIPMSFSFFSSTLARDAPNILASLSSNLATPRYRNPTRRLQPESCCCLSFWLRVRALAGGRSPREGRHDSPQHKWDGTTASITLTRAERGRRRAELSQVREPRRLVTRTRPAQNAAASALERARRIVSCQNNRFAGRISARDGVTHGAALYIFVR